MELSLLTPERSPPASPRSPAGDYGLDANLNERVCVSDVQIDVKNGVPHRLSGKLWRRVCQKYPNCVKFRHSAGFCWTHRPVMLDENGNVIKSPKRSPTNTPTKPPPTRSHMKRNNLLVIPSPSNKKVNSAKKNHSGKKIGRKLKRKQSTGNPNREKYMTRTSITIDEMPPMDALPQTPTMPNKDQHNPALNMQTSRGKFRSKKAAWQWLNGFWNEPSPVHSLFLEPPVVQLQGEDMGVLEPHAQPIPLLQVPPLAPKPLHIETSVSPRMDLPQSPLGVVASPYIAADNKKSSSSSSSSNSPASMNAAAASSSFNVHPAYIKPTVDLLLDTLRGDVHKADSIFADFMGGDLRGRLVGGDIRAYHSEHIHPAHLISQDLVLLLDKLDHATKPGTPNSQYMVNAILHASLSNNTTTTTSTNGLEEKTVSSMNDDGPSVEQPNTGGMMLMPKVNPITETVSMQDDIHRHISSMALSREITHDVDGDEVLLMLEFYQAKLRTTMQVLAPIRGHLKLGVETMFQPPYKKQKTNEKQASNKTIEEYKKYVNKKRNEMRARLMAEHREQKLRRQLSLAENRERNSASDVGAVFGAMYCRLDPTAPEEIVCAVCGDGDVDTGNEILFCDNCDIAMHQQCCGEHTVPEGDWYCSPCRFGAIPDQCQCVVCGRYGGAMKPTTLFTPFMTDLNRAPWAHISCGLWLPQCYFLDTNRMEPICGVEKIDPARRKLNCVICKTKGGAAIQCVEKQCVVAFHPTCAMEGDLEMSTVVTENDLRFVVYCDKHRKVPPKYKNRSFRYIEKKAALQKAEINAAVAAAGSTRAHAITLDDDGDTVMTSSNNNADMTVPGGSAAVKSPRADITSQLKKGHSSYETEVRKKVTAVKLTQKPDIWWCNTDKLTRSDEALTRQVTNKKASTKSKVSTPGKPKLMKKTTTNNNNNNNLFKQSSKKKHGVVKQSKLSSFFTGGSSSSSSQLTATDTTSTVKAYDTPILLLDGQVVGAVENEDPEAIYCICKQGWDQKEFMISCDKCEEWFHGVCVDILSYESELIDKYLCANCSGTNVPLKKYKEEKKPWWYENPE